MSKAIEFNHVSKQYRFGLVKYAHTLLDDKEAKLLMKVQDVYQTNADCMRLEERMGCKPHVTLHDEIGMFMEWYKIDKNPLLS